ncbi:hypothetical protein BC2230_11652 [Burkholderia cepacia]
MADNRTRRAQVCCALVNQSLLRDVDRYRLVVDAFRLNLLLLAVHDFGRCNCHVDSRVCAFFNLLQFFVQCVELCTEFRQLSADRLFPFGDGTCEVGTHFRDLLGLRLYSFHQLRDHGPEGFQFVACAFVAVSQNRDSGAQRIERNRRDIYLRGEGMLIRHVGFLRD